ncbi:hypothetical protein ACIBI9_59845 [Nonomuraea sp. NPDC050451]|uniref:hypothetical protein n=1 Tax=Nonomuraea sp. NPDC050451 TaxID=3364364 RepID=UPI0037B4BBD9
MRCCIRPQGFPAFPVRLASEIFQRAPALRGGEGPAVVCDPCCGSGTCLIRDGQVGQAKEHSRSSCRTTIHGGRETRSGPARPSRSACAGKGGGVDRALH